MIEVNYNEFRHVSVVLCCFMHHFVLFKIHNCIIPFNSEFHILSASFVIREWRQREGEGEGEGGGDNKSSKRGEGRDMGHMVNKSDVRDPGEALHP